VSSSWATLPSYRGVTDGIRSIHSGETGEWFDADRVPNLIWFVRTSIKSVSADRKLDRLTGSNVKILCQRGTKRPQ